MIFLQQMSITIAFSYSYDKKWMLKHIAEQERKATEYFDEMIQRRVIQDQQSFLMTELSKKLYRDLY